MSLFEITGLSHTFAEKSLYKNASFALHKGEHIGVVGPNGAGKSTLIQIMAGNMMPDEGQIKWQQGVHRGYLDQYATVKDSATVEAYLKSAFQPLYCMEKEMEELYQKGGEVNGEKLLLQAAAIQERLLEADFYSVDTRVARVAGGLGLNAIGLFQEMGRLSGGQKAKVILAKLLLMEPDVLLLDEPTNFLDKEHVAWLGEYLRSFRGAFVVVSHDFSFLERISEGICDIEFGTIRKYHGSYLSYLKQKEHLREEYIRQFHAQQKKIEETEAFIRKNKAGIKSKMARGRQKQLDRMEKLDAPALLAKPVIHFEEYPLETHDALEVRGLAVGYTNPLFENLCFTIKGGEKVVMTGFNGIGKSTLLKTLTGEIQPLKGGFTFAPQVRYAYYEQDLKWAEENKTPFEILSDVYPKRNKKEIRKYLARLGLKEDKAMQRISSMSGGEQSRVKLGCILYRNCNFLILDEPTNHFDADTKKALRDALVQFRGSVLLVSHEEAFYRDWADREISMEALREEKENGRYQ